MVRSFVRSRRLIRDRDRCRFAAMARSIARSRCRPTIHQFHVGEARSRTRITETPAGLRSRVEITLTVPAQLSLT
jgi:hypothetical protein